MRLEWTYLLTHNHRLLIISALEWIRHKHTQTSPLLASRAVVRRKKHFLGCTDLENFDPLRNVEGGNNNNNNHLYSLRISTCTSLGKLYTGSYGILSRTARWRTTLTAALNAMLTMSLWNTTEKSRTTFDKIFWIDSARDWNTLSLNREHLVRGRFPKGLILYPVYIFPQYFDSVDW